MSKYIPPALRNKQPEPEMDKPQRIPERIPERRRNRNYQKPQWEIQEEEDKKKAEEKKRAEERGLEKTEENFPSLGGSAPRVNTWGGGRKFSELASEWKEQADTNIEVVDKEEHFVLPRFRNIHRFIEPEDERPPPPEKTEDQNDGWTTVERKIKKKEFKSMFDEDGNIIEDDTVWGGEEEEETCWNDY
jgi:hypothetical protein